MMPQMDAAATVFREAAYRGKAADIPHAPRNDSGKRRTWIVVHSSGSDQDGIVLLPDLDAKLAQRMSAPARAASASFTSETGTKRRLPQSGGMSEVAA